MIAYVDDSDDKSLCLQLTHGLNVIPSCCTAVSECDVCHLTAHRKSPNGHGDGDGMAVVSLLFYNSGSFG